MIGLGMSAISDSWYAFAQNEKTVEAYQKRVEEGKIPVFVQGLGKNVVEEFKREEAAILIGMESFGEGIDIPGEKLQFIVVDKIPDVRQDLVIQKRRDFFEFKFGNEFNDYLSTLNNFGFYKDSLTADMVETFFKNKGINFLEINPDTLNLEKELTSKDMMLLCDEDVKLYC